MLNDMKYKIIIVWLIVTFACSGTYAVDFKNNEAKIAKELFVKSESIAIKNRAKIAKNRFLDPIGNNELFYKIVKRETPDLINNTSKYKFGLMKLLEDKTIKKDWYTEFDIVNLLCNLCLEDYIDIIDSVRILVIKNQLKFEILEHIVIQDFNLTNLLARNYQNTKLKELLKQIKQDIKFGKIVIPTNNFGFMEELNKLESGETWENDLKQDEIKHPPLLNPKNCR